MFQERDYLSRNWDASPIRPRNLDAILLTHAHVDHCGMAPVLVREGFRGPLITTAASADLVELVLKDAAEIQAEDAAFKQKRHRKEGRQGKYPIKPLFSFKDVDRTLPILHTAEYGQEYKINDRVSAVFHDAGHILGSAIIELFIHDNNPKGTVPFSLTRKSGQSPNGQGRRFIFTGDLGQMNKPIVRDPETFSQADYIVMESTYGNRDHENGVSVESQLERVVCETVAAGGCIVIPIFAIERAQELIYYLNRLLHDGRIPQMPVFLDSPMAADVNEVFRDHRDCFDAEALEMLASGQSIFKFPALKVVRTQAESMAINDVKGPFIVMSTSGMCTAGRIKHHLAHHIDQPACTILFVGYQARGTLGRQILDGNKEVRIHGRSHLVRARVAHIQGISGHADRSGLMKWLSYFQSPPRQLFVTHGEEDVSLSFAKLVRESIGWKVTVPEYKQTVELE
jgi:metallo-beta-lactamase family protein